LRARPRNPFGCQPPLAPRAGQAGGVLAAPLLGLGERSLARGDPGAAAPLLERALAVHDFEANPAVQITLAEALWQIGKDRPRAIDLAEQARASYEHVGHQPGQARAARWLAEHPRAN